MSDNNDQANTEVTRVEVEEHTSTNEDTGDERDLGDAGKRALDAERRSRKEAERKAAEMDKKLAEALKRIEGYEDANRSEVEKMEHQLKKTREQLEDANKQRDDSNRRLLVYKIATEYGLPADMADRLQGDTEDELREDAEKLQNLLAPAGARVPWPVHQEGSNTGKNRTVEQVFADSIRPFLN